MCSSFLKLDLIKVLKRIVYLQVVWDIVYGSDDGVRQGSDKKMREERGVMQ